MLSNLCKEVGHELYEMDGAVRDELLHQLQQDDRFGLERVRELADFVMAYIEQQLDSPDLDVRDLATSQQWRALAYKNPSEAAHHIAAALAQLPLNEKAEWIRMASLVNSLAEPLSAFQPLLNYVRAMADLARGNVEAAATQMAKTVDANNQVRVEGVNLPIPDALNGKLPQSTEQDTPAISPPNWFVKPIAIAGGIVISLLIVIAWVSQPIRPNRQATPLSSATPTPQTSSSATPTPQASPSPSPRSSPSPSPTSPQSVMPQQTPEVPQAPVASQPQSTRSSTSPTTDTSVTIPNANSPSSTIPSNSSIQRLPNPTQSPVPQSPVSQSPMPQSPASPLPSPLEPGTTISVTRIEVTGSTVFSERELQAITQPLEGKPATLKELQSATDAIKQLYIDRGYVTSAAVLPEQTLTNGVVNIRVVEGSLERIDVEGTQTVNPDDIRQIVQRGVSVPLNANDLESQLQVLEADPRFTSVKASLNPGTQVGQSILVVQVTEANRNLLRPDIKQPGKSRGGATR
jgi:hypothetical protein